MAMIDLDTEIVIQNNRRGIFVYNNGRGSAFELTEFGEDGYVSMRTLKALSTGRDKEFLRNFSLLVIDVNDEEVTLDDVLKELRLTKNYNEAKEILKLQEVTAESFDEAIKKANVTQMKKILANKNLRAVASESLIEQYKIGSVQPGVVEYMLTERGVADPYSFMEDLRRTQEYTKK